MKTKPRRDLSVAGAMIMVAATAIGLAYMRATLFDLPDRLGRTSHRGTRHLILAQYVLGILLPLITAWTPALLLIRLRTLSVRPALRQPGTVAALAGTAAIILLTPITVINWAINPNLHQFAWTVLIERCPCVGFAVIGGWTGLLVGCRWRSEPSLIDRTSRMLGCLWIVATVVSLAATIILKLS
jgi:hypothetical protein